MTDYEAPRDLDRLLEWCGEQEGREKAMILTRAIILYEQLHRIGAYGEKITFELNGKTYSFIFGTYGGRENIRLEPIEDKSKLAGKLKAPVKLPSSQVDLETAAHFGEMNHDLHGDKDVFQLTPAGSRESQRKILATMSSPIDYLI